jgi:MarR family 2-MHQ and catechol resistance regulon transcriptional repressor
VLEALLHKGPLPVNTIGPRVHLTPGAISVAVDRLQKNGLVQRSEDEKDRRVRVVSLTPKGRKLIERVFAQHAAQMNALAEELPAKERRRIAEGLKTLGKRAAQGQKPVK